MGSAIGRKYLGQDGNFHLGGGKTSGGPDTRTLRNHGTNKECADDTFAPRPAGNGETCSRQAQTAGADIVRLPAPATAAEDPADPQKSPGLVGM